MDVSVVRSASLYSSVLKTSWAGTARYAIICVGILLSGCKAGVLTSKNARSFDSTVKITSTKSNLGAAGGVATTAGNNYKVKFTMGYNQQGSDVSTAGGNIKLTPTSAGVNRAR